MDLQKELVKLCDSLNREKVKYAIIGGCAVVLHGYFRTTNDIDLLVDSSSENIMRLKKALHDLWSSEDVFEIGDDDIEQYAVVRFAPESEDIAIDLIGKIGKITFEVAIENIEELEIEGVKVPLCGLSTLIETKRGIRPKDKEDLLFLKGKMEYLKEKNRNED
jgi:predicted nucleotidyltransferase